MDIRIRELMRATVVVVHVSAPLGAVRRTLEGAPHRQVLVVDDDGALVGVLDARDLRRQGLDGPGAPDDLPLARVTTRPVAVAPPDASASRAAARLVELRIDALAIVDGKRLVGLVTAADLLGWFATQSEAFAVAV